MSHKPLTEAVSIVTAACFLAFAVSAPSVTVAQTQAPPPGAPAAAAPPAGQTAPSAPAFKQEELDAMLAPIALYPDALLAQVLMASTYPLEIVEAARWAEQNKGLKGDALQNALQGQKWDESVKSLAAFPDVLNRMNKDLAWTQKLGDAFLSQQKQVMDTVQGLRKKAADAGNLKTTEQQKVVVENNYYTIEPANPQVVYVPTYQPTVVYGAWPYPAYPPYYPTYWAPVGAAFVSGFFWGAGIAAGAALWGGCNWGRGDVNINVNRYNNINTNNRINANSNRTNWNHNPEHRQSGYRGGEQTRQNLNGKYQSGNREQYRGKDASRDASRERANQTMQSRGIESPTGSAREREQAMSRDASRAQASGAGRDFSGSGNRDNALRGADSGQARAQADRGAASSRAATHHTSGSGARAGGGGGGSRASAGGGGRPSGGGGARGGGGGGGRRR